MDYEKSDKSEISEEISDLGSEKYECKPFNKKDSKGQDSQ